MRKQIALGATLALGLGLASHAMAADGFSYSNVEVGFGQGKFSMDGGEGAIDAKGDGFSLSGSAAFTDTVFGFANFSSLSLDDFELNGSNVSTPGAKVKVEPITVGVGFHWALANALDFVAGVSYEHMKITANDGSGSVSVSDSGYGVSAGLRGRVGDRVELTGTLKHLDIGGSELVYSVGGRFYFTESFATGVDYTKYDDSNLSNWLISLRYDFGK